MIRSPDDFLAHLDGLGIRTTTHAHAAVFTVAESASIKESLPGAHSKNLFLKDRKDRIFLVVARQDTAIDLKRIHETIGASGRVSFGSPALLLATLGVEPGSVTPFGVVNDAEGRVSVVLDAILMESELLNFHPLVNTRTTAIAREDLVRFLRASGHEPRILALPAPLAAEGAPAGSDADCARGAPRPS